MIGRIGRERIGDSRSQFARGMPRKFNSILLVSLSVITYSAWVTLQNTSPRVMFSRHIPRRSAP